MPVSPLQRSVFRLGLHLDHLYPVFGIPGLPITSLGETLYSGDAVPVNTDTEVVLSMLPELLQRLLPVESGTGKLGFEGSPPCPWLCLPAVEGLSSEPVNNSVRRFELAHAQGARVYSVTRYSHCWLRKFSHSCGIQLEESESRLMTCHLSLELLHVNSTHTTEQFLCLLLNESTRKHVTSTLFLLCCSGVRES